MKKLFMFLAVAGLATFGASCSSSDDNGGDDKKTLTLSADKTSVKVDETVTFTVSEKDAELYVEGKKISSNSTKFDKEGSYKVVAKKNGFNDSNVVTIKVIKDGTPGEPGDNEKETLKLTILPTEVTLGNAVSFVVYEGTTDVSSSAKIFVNGSEITGASYTATAVGTYAVVAKKEGANDSAEKTFEVTEAPTVPESNFFAAGSDIENIEEVRLYAHANAQNQILVYSDIVEGKDMAIFELVSFGDDEGIFSMMIAVEQPEDAEGIITPKLAVDLDLVHGPLGAYAAFGSGTEVDATQEAGFGYNFVADANGASVPGNVVFGLEDTALEAAYEGEFTGLFALNVSAKGVKSSKGKYVNAISKVVK